VEARIQLLELASAIVKNNPAMDGRAVAAGRILTYIETNRQEINQDINNWTPVEEETREAPAGEVKPPAGAAPAAAPPAAATQQGLDAELVKRVDNWTRRSANIREALNKRPAPQAEVQPQGRALSVELPIIQPVIDAAENVAEEVLINLEERLGATPEPGTPLLDRLRNDIGLLARLGQAPTERITPQEAAPLPSQVRRAQKTPVEEPTEEVAPASINIEGTIYHAIRTTTSQEITDRLRVAAGRSERPRYEVWRSGENGTWLVRSYGTANLSDIADVAERNRRFIDTIESAVLPAMAPDELFVFIIGGETRVVVAQKTEGTTWRIYEKSGLLDRMPSAAPTSTGVA